MFNLKYKNIMEEKLNLSAQLKSLTDSLGENSKRLSEIFSQIVENPTKDLITEAWSLVERNTSTVNKVIEMAKMDEAISFLVPSLERSRVAIEATRDNLTVITNNLIENGIR